MGIWPVFTSKVESSSGRVDGKRSKIILIHYPLCFPSPQLWSGWLAEFAPRLWMEHISLPVLQPVTPLRTESQIQKFIWGKKYWLVDLFPCHQTWFLSSFITDCSCCPGRARATWGGSATALAFAPLLWQGAAKCCGGRGGAQRWFPLGEHRLQARTMTCTRKFTVLSSEKCSLCRSEEE